VGPEDAGTAEMKPAPAKKARASAFKPRKSALTLVSSPWLLESYVWRREEGGRKRAILRLSLALGTLGPARVRHQCAL
jgi:hypothetical protein